MAKNAAKPQGASRIRLVVLEAEGDGDLSQIAHAMQNALRPREQVIVQRRIVSAPEKTAHDDHEDEFVDAEELNEADLQGSPAPALSKPTKPRPAASSPKVLNDVDLVTEPSFDAFAKEKNPQSDRMKYLVVATWFKEHRGIDSITMHHVYTCFRAIKWSIPKGDFSQPLRNLKFAQLMGSSKRGEYSINHLGIAEVEKPSKNNI